MSDPTEQAPLQLKRMLEEVTARGEFAAGDAEAADLREAWLAFEQLAEAADASLPPLPDLRAPLSPRRAAGSRGRWLGLIAAMAAALLIAVTSASWSDRHGTGHVGSMPGGLARDTGQENSSPHAAQPDLPQPAAPRSEDSQGQAAESSPSVRGSPSVRASVWEDPLETQVAAISQRISTLEQNWRHRVDDVDLVQYDIDEMSESLQSDAL